MRRKFRAVSVRSVTISDRHVVIEDVKEGRMVRATRKIIPVRAITDVRTEHSSCGVRTLRIAMTDERIVIKLNAPDAVEAAALIGSMI